ncbi:hypothetical protein [Streptomyces sp. NPDC049590]|uniref:hypothetical protein n=1 Tax=Streptomyces sp. NPDC049590 TaxID=3154834 RepID=UPI0034378D67
MERRPPGPAAAAHRYGFEAALSGRGHTLADVGARHEPATGLRARADRLREHGADLVTSASTATGLALFHRQARQAGRGPG